VMDILGVILVVVQYGVMVYVKVVIIKERKIWTVQGNLSHYKRLHTNQ
jgi:phage repressor protein C with HTH and peptisase S24 domain